MTRVVLNFLTAVSLALCAAVTASRVRGSHDRFAFSPGNRFTLSIMSDSGRTLVVTGVSNPRRVRHEFSKTGWGPFPHEWVWHERRPPGESGYRFKRGDVIVALPHPDNPRHFGGWSAPMPAFELAAPTGPIMVATSVLPVVWLARRARAEVRALLRWRRFSRGRCTSCGYDLRGSAGRCPECGGSQEELVEPWWWRVASAIGTHAKLFGRWSVTTAALGIFVRLFDDRSTDFPDGAQTAEHVLAIAGVLCGVIAGGRGRGHWRIGGALAALLNLGLLWLALQPRLNR